MGRHHALHASHATRVSRCWVPSAAWRCAARCAAWSRCAMGWLDALAHRVGLCSRLLLELVYPGGPVLCDQALHLQLLLRCLVEFRRRRQARFQLSHAASLSLARLDEILSLPHQLLYVGLCGAIIRAEHAQRFGPCAQARARRVGAFRGFPLQLQTVLRHARWSPPLSPVNDLNKLLDPLRLPAIRGAHIAPNSCPLPPNCPMPPSPTAPTTAPQNCDPENSQVACNHVPLASAASPKPPWTQSPSPAPALAWRGRPPGRTPCAHWRASARHRLPIR